MFANGLGNRGSISGWVIPKTQKWYLMPPCLALSIMRWGSRVKWNNPGNGVAPSLLHLHVVAIEKRAFGSPLTRVTNFTYLETKSFKTHSKSFKNLLPRLETQKKIACPGSWYNNNKKTINLMSLAQRMHFYGACSKWQPLWLS